MDQRTPVCLEWAAPDELVFVSRSTAPDYRRVSGEFGSFSASTSGLDEPSPAVRRLSLQTSFSLMGMMMGEGAYRPGVRPTGRKWPRLEDELGGFIFITSADAMREARNDGEEEQGVEDKATGTTTMKFALPAAFAETVAKIALGMPVFLYDVTHRLLHGVYEASPCEEQYNRNPIPANGSRFPAHVSTLITLPPSSCSKPS